MSFQEVDISDEVNIPQKPALTYLYIHIRTGMGHVTEGLAGVIETVYAAAAEQGLEPPGPSFCAYLEREFDPRHFVLNASASAEGNFVSAGEVRVAHTPAGPAAVILHIGPYDSMSSAFIDVDEWTKVQGRVPNGSAREVYLVSWGQAEPSDFRTEVIIPVK